MSQPGAIAAVKLNRKQTAALKRANAAVAASSHDSSAAAAAADPDDPHAAMETMPPDDIMPTQRRQLTRAHSDQGSSSSGGGGTTMMFAMDGDAEEILHTRTATSAATAATSSTVASSSSSSMPTRSLSYRRGSVESELLMQAIASLPSSDDENGNEEATDHLTPIAIARADSPEGEEDLESALLNSTNGFIPAAAASTAAGSVPSEADYRFMRSTSCPTTGVHIGDFELLSVIGRGAYGKVFLVRRRVAASAAAAGDGAGSSTSASGSGVGRYYAMKVIKKSEAIRKNVVANMKAERTVLEAVRHPFIVNLRYAFQTHSKLYLVLDFISGGELFSRLDEKRDHALPVKEARFYAAELVLALEYLHSFDIVYRDLKPENILLNRDGHIVLTDFGFAKDGVEKNEEGCRSFCGTLHYLSPEIISYSGHGKGSDWWSLGCCLYEMLCGTTPFNGSNRKKIQDNILSAPLKFPSFLDQPTKSILTELLRRSIPKRLGCGPDGVAAIKRHSFFHGIDWVALAKKQVTPPFIPVLEHAHDTKYFDAKFTEERVVDTPILTSDMAAILHGAGISPQTFHEADSHFLNFSYLREHTPAPSPALRAMIINQHSLPVTRSSSTGGGGAGSAFASPRVMSGLPPMHHPSSGSTALASMASSAAASTSAASSYAHHFETLELPKPLSISDPAAASSSSSAATSTTAPSASAETEWATALAANASPSSSSSASTTVFSSSRNAANTNHAASSSIFSTNQTHKTVASPVKPVKPKPVKMLSPPPAAVAAQAVAPADLPSVATPTNTSTNASTPIALASPPPPPVISGLTAQLAQHQQRKNQSAISSLPAPTVTSATTTTTMTTTTSKHTLASPPSIRVLGGISQLQITAPPAVAVTLASTAATAALTVAASATATTAPRPIKTLSASAVSFVPSGAWKIPTPPASTVASTSTIQQTAKPAAAAVNQLNGVTSSSSSSVAGSASSLSTSSQPSASAQPFVTPGASPSAPRPIVPMKPGNSNVTAAAAATSNNNSNQPLGPPRWGQTNATSASGQTSASNATASTAVVTTAFEPRKSAWGKQ